MMVEPTNQMFYHNAEITSIVLPTTFEDLNSTIANTPTNWAFENCTKLEQVTILNGTGKLNICFFNGCANLKSIVIPVGITEIGMSAFNGCTSLTTINYTGTEAEWTAITIGTDNEALTNATKVYNYVV